jgi:hypothetical protein
MKTLAIKNIERDFPNQWLVIEVIATKNGAPSMGYPTQGGQQTARDCLIGSNKGKNLFFLFSGFPHRAIRLSG